MAEALEPSNLELEQQQAYVAMDLQEWQEMDLLADDVLARAPVDRSAVVWTGSERSTICPSCASTRARVCTPITPSAVRTT
jgi:hypothetical protein